MDKIFIKGLALEAVIGIYEHEKGIKQPLKVDLEFHVDTTIAAESDLIHDTVDYDLVAQYVAEIVSASTSELLEALAEQVATSLLKRFKTTQVVCTLYKPQALNNAETVGITIKRPKIITDEVRG